MPGAGGLSMIRARMKRTAEGTELGREAPMVITPRRLAELFKRVVTGVQRRVKAKA